MLSGDEARTAALAWIDRALLLPVPLRLLWEVLKQAIFAIAVATFAGSFLN